MRATRRDARHEARTRLALTPGGLQVMGLLPERQRRVVPVAAGPPSLPQPEVPATRPAEASPPRPAAAPARPVVVAAAPRPRAAVADDAEERRDLEQRRV